MLTNNAPPRHLVVKRGNEEKSLFMSYALLSQVTKLIGGADQLPVLASDLDMQENVLKAAFTERSEDKKTVTYIPASLEELEVELADIQRVLDWVGEHVTDFFTRRTLSTIAQVDKLNKAIAKESGKLMPTNPGSPSSDSGTAAA